MERGVACWLVAAIVVLAVVAPGASAAGAPAAESVSAQDGDAFGLPQEFDPDTVSLSADLAADGDAEWQFTYRMRLETDNETAAFEDLRDDINANTSDYLDRFRGRITNTVDAAANATGREMAVENVSVSTRVNSLNEESLGVVTYSFQWRGFAETDGERVTAGDALEGFYLDEKTSLTVSWPSGYALESVDPVGSQPKEGAVRWSGPVEFGPDEPRVVVAPAPEETTTTTTTGGSGGDDSDESTGDSGGLVVPAAIGALVAVVVLGAGGWLYVRQHDTGEGSSPPVAGTTEPDDGAGGGGTGEAAGAAAGAGAGSGGDDDSGDDGGPPSELLSNEERVEQFLESEGGRAKQQAVVEALDWTEAKTSQVVSEMHENDAIEKFRIGRENVLKLPDADDLDE
ncbi:helix-turn-helix transcriptional regulator [Halobacterium rubrum]|uniref:helix-turn-helix transcriptional regulator n=1 Tax=Halobacterium TaxID=2239 RepID=UPI001F30A291|nr:MULTISPECIES: hypothetical protein [Halobacterium]MDH5020895.1 hypothetical protein [Halobacterium rubrum]